MRFAVRLSSVAALGLMILGSTQALGAPGGGATTATGPCAITVPGFGEATGRAMSVVTPSGRENVTCVATLAPTATPPATAQRFTAGPCVITVAPSGVVVERC